MRRLAINRCPHGIHSISIDDVVTEASTSLTPRCCERRAEVYGWTMTEDKLRELANVILYEADQEVSGQ